MRMKPLLSRSNTNEFDSPSNTGEFLDNSTHNERLRPSAALRLVSAGRDLRPPRQDGAPLVASG
eukprot:1195255-Prorocentrum_minimum.AAC.5